MLYLSLPFVSCVSLRVTNGPHVDSENVIMPCARSNFTHRPSRITAPDEYKKSSFKNTINRFNLSITNVLPQRWSQFKFLHVLSCTIHISYSYVKWYPGKKPKTNIPRTVPVCDSSMPSTQQSRSLVETFSGAGRRYDLGPTVMEMTEWLPVARWMVRLGNFIHSCCRNTKKD